MMDLSRVKVTQTLMIAGISSVRSRTFTDSVVKVSHHGGFVCVQRVILALRNRINFFFFFCLY